jgi:hypothetical protein
MFNNWHSPLISTKPLKQTAPNMHKRSLNLQIKDNFAARKPDIKTAATF